MPEFITHVPSQEELEKWSAAQKTGLTPDSVGNFAFGGAESQEMKKYFAYAIAEVNGNTNIDEDTRRQATEVLNKGTLNGQTIGMEDVNRNVSSEWGERSYIARLLMTGSEGKQAAEAIIQKGVCGFHSTRSQALAGILETGKLMSASMVEENKHLMITGEHIYQRGHSQKFVSFSNLADTKETALNYAGYHGVKIRDHETVLNDMREKIEQIQSFIDPASPLGRVAEADARRHEVAVNHLENNPDSLFATLNQHEFPVMLGVARDYIQETEQHRQSRHLLEGVGSLGEFRPAENEIPLSALPVVAVPREVIAPVKELFKTFGYPDVKVVSFEAMVA